METLIETITDLMLARTSTRTVDLFEKLVATAQTSSIKIQDELNEVRFAITLLDKRAPG